MSWVGPNRQTRGFSVFRAGLRADGQIAVSLAKDAAERELIRLSDPATGRPMGRPAPHYPGWIVRAVAFSPDGRMLRDREQPAQPSDGRAATLGREHGPVAFCRRFRTPTMYPRWHSSPTASSWPRATITDWSGSGTPPPAREIGRPLPQGEIVLSLAYSPDGTMLAVGLANGSCPQARHSTLGYHDTPTHR